MSTMRKLLLGATVAVTLFGCKSGTSDAAAAGAADPSSGAGAASAAAAASSSMASGGTSVQQIQDPSLNMNAVSVTIPASWHFQGTLMQGGNCVGTPFPVFRVTSPDGLSAFEREPTVGWRWGSGPLATSPTDCMGVKGAISAQDFLKYLAGTMGVQYVADVPEPAAENAAAQAGLQAAVASVAAKYAAEHITPPKSTRQLARAQVQFQNGTFAMKGEMRVTMDCIETVTPGMKSMLQGIPDRPSSTVDQCTASTRYYTAPAAQLAAVTAVWDTPGMGAVELMPWEQAWVARNQQQANAAEAKNIQATNAAMAASAQKFQQDMATQAQMHQQFLATMQRGTDASMAAANASMNAQSTSASDWVDYALDEQTVMNPSTGQTSKVSSAYSYTWTNGSTSYQTNDPNANPNGVMQGTWTKQQVVHGNGTP